MEFWIPNLDLKRPSCFCDLDLFNFLAALLSKMEWWTILLTAQLARGAIKIAKVLYKADTRPPKSPK